MSKGWSARTDWHTVCARASGRRHYNSWRQQMAELRRVQVLVMLLRHPGLPLVDIAEAFKVSPSTISRDRQRLLEHDALRGGPLHGSR